ncbi:tetratricopeptide repeat protein [uncultured Dechloromonas sp.]|uniref:tetratricopeptide repeat protein n=1 Tax=uncultured Dechloromonas sp. TaxID=171719 RepID=UPI0025E34C16|nr:tetratricopeptide repeat protein [uncultured Dechloromonas sp.]
MMFARCLCLASGLVLFSTALFAAAEDDYQAGLKSYRNGDIVGAMTPLRQASLEGHAKAQALLAEILDRTDFDEDAIVLYRKSADQGDLDGMFGLGVMIVSGEGTKKDLPAGRAWILKAAEAGHVLAINAIAQAYLKGELGFTEAERNTPDALTWAKRAADNDYLPAIDALAAAYGSGNAFGVQVDRALSERYQAQANRIRSLDPGKGKKKQRRL